LRTRAIDEREIQVAVSDEIAEATCCKSAEFSLARALRPPCFWRVKANEAHIWLGVIETYRIAIDNTHLIGLNRIGSNNSAEGQKHC
jgi:hypothetical protein